MNRSYSDSDNTDLINKIKQYIDLKKEARDQYGSYLLCYDEDEMLEELLERYIKLLGDSNE